jgi:hypothetical protein
MGVETISTNKSIVTKKTHFDACFKEMKYVKFQEWIYFELI